MIVVSSRHNVVLTVRVEPGENVVSALQAAIADQDFSSAAVVAVAGSAEMIRYGVVELIDGIPTYEDPIELLGAIEFTGVQGHLGREADGSPTFHLHGSFALSDGSVVAGHLYDARALVTVEVTMIGTPQSEWVRSHQPYGDGHSMPVLNPIVRHPPAPSGSHNEETHEHRS